MDFEKAKQQLKESIDDSETQEDILRIWIEKVYQKGKEDAITAPEEFNERMRLISKIEDEEERHYEADELMCLLLEKIGYQDGVKIFRDMKKWYA